MTTQARRSAGINLAGPPAAPEDIRSIGSTLDWLRREGLLLETDVPVSGDLEVIGLQKHFDGSVPILFNNVRDYEHARVVTNLFCNMDILDRMFGWEGRQDRTRKLAHALTHPLPCEIVTGDEAPCQEEVITDDLDVNKYVVTIRHTALEPERTIGSGNSVVVGDYFRGGSHIGYNRMNFRWGNVGTFQSAPGSHMWQVITEHYDDPDGIPLTMCFGLPPACTLIAGGGFDYVVLPRGADELGAAGAVQGFPVRLVKARTVDAWAVADCDLVLEGVLKPRDKRYETADSEEAGVQGRLPFHPEWAGYMGKAYRAPTFHVSAITMRRRESKPAIYALGVHMADDSNIDTTVREAAIYELCERLQPGIVQDVHIPFCMTDWGGCIIQVKKRNRIEEGWQRNFLAAALACSQGMRLAIAVDTDIDMYSMDDIMWALTTRVNPHTDILNPLPGGIGQTFQPAERMTAGEKEWTASNTRFEGGMGIDATMPFGYESDFQRPVYPIDRVDPADWFSGDQVEAARAVMKGWVEVLARTGR
ncbi:MAG: UbiD family decarboxylase [Thermoleophilia bacterium]|nr:UbiD family decarboxylase [Thermoleophilia bacterium]